MTKKSKGYARVEFLANLKKIQELTHQGYTKKAIYEQLMEKGKVTMTYIHFCRFDPLTGQNLRSRKLSKPSPAITGTPAVRTVSAALVPVSPGGGGSHAGQPDNDSGFSFSNEVTQEEMDKEFF